MGRNRREDYSHEDATAAYERNKENVINRSRRIGSLARDISEIPDVVDPERRASCERDFQTFCESYFPAAFPLEWSEDHKRVLLKTEAAVVHGGLFAMAMPRGSGKTTIAEIAVIWSSVYAHRHFPLIIGSDETSATELLESIQSEFEYNELLAEDFPEVCYPIACLEGIPRRAEAQTYEGERTLITMTKKEIVLPTIAGSPSSGIVVRSRGITGRLRGMKFKRADGVSVRPDLVIIDDPQTDQSATSPTQVSKRMSLLRGTILNLAGPGKKIAGIVPCTVIANNDVAHQLLDRQENPEFNGELAKMLYEFPTNRILWDEYQLIREESLRSTGTIAEATEFYRKNQKEMDEGARVGWPARYLEDELSAIQHAMNKLFIDEESFYAEMQNEPRTGTGDEESLISHKDLCNRTNSTKRFVVPDGTETLNAFIDVQGQALYYAVVASGAGFTSHVVDYGVFPDQGTRVFTLVKLRKTLEKVIGTKSPEGRIYGGLDLLTQELFGRDWIDEGGATIRLNRCLIDCGFQTDTVYQFCRKTKLPVMPSQGFYIGAKTQPLMEQKRKPGEKIGLNWRIPPNPHRRVHCVRIDTNYWKTFLHQRLKCEYGSKGALYLYEGSKREHEQFANHLLAEYPTRTEGKGRVLDEWTIHAGGPDNHWLDCIVGCLVAANMAGIGLKEAGSSSVPVKKRRVAKLPGR